MFIVELTHTFDEDIASEISNSGAQSTQNPSDWSQWGKWYTNIFSNETYLSYIFSSGNDFFKSIIFNHYDGSSFQLKFTCIQSINTTCSSQINENDKKLILEINYPIKLGLNILDIRTSSFDATNVTVETPADCGYQVIKWVNGNKYNFSYASPTVSKIKITSTNIIVKGSDFCDSSFQPNITIDGTAIQNSIDNN
ncbi:hypothetical protein RB653_010021 [Dictyostelium firmibasis]|uniref:TgrO1-like immunoglobulin-like domain-containing protein n=1 Tax=Dictyostelium firmibasis TaxID=79012 RepID=A0AAN7TT45_9MYCE